jgi:endonuclease/exonuclease/phosphatase (EEP) superfamily protein YafD
MWLGFVLVFAEEPWSLLRLMTSVPSSGQRERAHDESIRVVSLNCNVGSPGAAEEVARYRPDIILLQESPGRSTLEALRRKLFGTEGGIVPGVDASLVVRGRVVPADLSADLRANCVQARVVLPSGTVVEVISTRLVPAVFRLDLWSPDCWREQRENRQRRRAQLTAMVRRLEVLPPTMPIIVGGDFNAPQGDAVFHLLQPRLHDAFAEGGRGWGNTIINDVPFLRIDQIWTNAEFRWASVVARRTRHSDHRMVVADLILRARAKARADSPQRD